ncbi:MAG: hypothetical protein MAG795_00818 [Candidatus Woesearchaeota archaeon]|nr:hypothetical protein [Candidatus Woesearchaeota archaeon]
MNEVEELWMGFEFMYKTIMQDNNYISDLLSELR